MCIVQAIFFVGCSFVLSSPVQLDTNMRIVSEMADKTGVIIYGVVAVVLVVAVHQMCNVMGLIIYGSLVFLCISIANVIMVWVVTTLILTKADSPDALGQLGTVTKNSQY